MPPTAISHQFKLMRNNFHPLMIQTNLMSCNFYFHQLAKRTKSSNQITVKGTCKKMVMQQIMVFPSTCKKNRIIKSKSKEHHVRKWQCNKSWFCN